MENERDRAEKIMRKYFGDNPLIEEAVAELKYAYGHI